MGRAHILPPLLNGAPYPLHNHTLLKNPSSYLFTKGELKNEGKRCSLKEGEI